MIHFKDDISLFDTNEIGLSFVISYYKGEKYIFKCLNSILNSAELSNKKIAYEIILVIDSIEDSKEIRAKIKKEYSQSKIEIIILINEKNIGVSESRNVGLKQSKYQYFTIMDQDDYVLDNYFSVIENSLDGLNSAYILNGYINYESHNKKIPMYFFKPRFDFKSILNKSTIIYTPGLVIFDSEFVSKSNFFIDTSNKYKGSDDWAAYLIFLINNPNSNYKYVNKKVFIYSLHSDNFSNNIDVMMNSCISVLNYLNSLNIISSENKKLINFSYSMHKFYLAKNFNMLNKIPLFKKFPKQFMNHYFFSFLSLDRQNRLIFNVRKILL